MSSSAARIVAITAGVTGAAVAGVALVREVALALDPDVVWVYPSWGGWLTSTSGLRPAVAAAVAGAAALLCLLFSVRFLRRPVAPLRRLDLGGEEEAVRVEASTLDRFVAQALRRRLPALDSARVWLYRRQPDGYEARVAVQLRACMELSELHARVAALVRDELRRAAGLEVGRVDLEVEKVEPRRKGET